MKQFSDVNLPPQLSSSLAEMGFITPTPIQCEAIPIALEGKDILGSAQTGTGKTGAFGIPLIASLLNNPEGGAMVLLPTRELAVQVMDALRKMLGNTQIRTALLIGGQSMFKQFNQLRSKPRIIVGTPGRINDHLKRKTLNLDKTNFLVLDETDRMLDMGFGIQLKEISKHLTAKRQTLMFSATLPSNIKKLSAEYLTDPVRISVGETSAPAINIKQEHAFVSESEKFPRLLDELNSRKGSIIIFVKTKHGAAKLAEKLTTYGHETDAIHGNLRQNKRDSVIGNFRKEKYRILVATDVACRGLDIPHIEHVINYDIPQASEDYIHRIGRTARAGAQGSALSLLSPGDNAKWRAIQFLLDPTKKLEPLPRGNGGGNGGGRGNDRNRARKGGFKRWERKSGDRPEGQGERRSSFGGGDRRKSFGTPRPASDGESRPSRDGEQRPEGQGERRPFSGDRRKSFGGQRPSGDGERRSSFGGGDRRKSFGNSPRPAADGERRSRPDGERRLSFGGGDRPEGQGERRPFSGDRRKSFGGGSARPNGNSERRPSFGSARPTGNGERRPTLGLDRPSVDGERRSRPDGERKSSFGGDRRKSFGGGSARPSGQGDRRKSFGGSDRRKAAA
jgi:ATP-dependent RNA helicase DeaD